MAADEALEIEVPCAEEEVEVCLHNPDDAADAAASGSPTKGGNKKKKQWRTVTTELYEPAPYVAPKGSPKGGGAKGKGGGKGADGEHKGSKGKGKANDGFGNYHGGAPGAGATGEYAGKGQEEGMPVKPMMPIPQGQAALDGDMAQLTHTGSPGSPSAGGKGRKQAKDGGGKSREGKGGGSAGGGFAAGGCGAGCGGAGGKPGVGGKGAAGGPRKGGGGGGKAGGGGVMRGPPTLGEGLEPDQLPLAVEPLGALAGLTPGPAGVARYQAPRPATTGPSGPGQPVRAMLPPGGGLAMHGMPLAAMPPYSPFGQPPCGAGGAMQFPYGAMPAMYMMPQNFSMPQNMLPPPAFFQQPGGVMAAQPPPPIGTPERLSLTTEVQAQVEHYFCRENLIKDVYLRSRLMSEEGWVNVAQLGEFPRIKQKTADMSVLLEAIASSQDLELNADGLSIRLKQNWQEWVLPPTRVANATSAAVS